MQQTQLLNIQLIDMSGRVVLTRDIQAKEGNNDIRFDGLGNLSEGIYFIKIITPDAVLQQKVLKVNGQ